MIRYAPLKAPGRERWNALDEDERLILVEENLSADKRRDLPLWLEHVQRFDLME